MTLNPGIVTVLLHKSDDLVILAVFILLCKNHVKKIIVFASSLLSDCLNCLTSCV